MRELDAVLEAFLRDSFVALTDSDKLRFEALLELPDPELYGYVARRAEPGDPNDARLIERIRCSLYPHD